MSDKAIELLPCPFCGSEPEFPNVDEVYGTCYDAGCNDCCVATISIQIIDCFDYGESPNRDDAHNSWDKEALKYGDEFIEVARSEAIERWNTRQAAKEQYAPMGSKIVAHLKQKLKDYVNDYAYTEPDTGATAFSPREAEEYAHHLDELIHEIETLIGDKE